MQVYKFFILVQLLFHAQISNGQNAMISLTVGVPNNMSPITVKLEAKADSGYLVSHILHALRFLLINDF